MAGQEQPPCVMSLLFAANQFRTHASAPSCDHDSEQRPTSAFTVAHHSLVHACRALSWDSELRFQQHGQTRLPIKNTIRNRRSADHSTGLQACTSHATTYAWYHNSSESQAAVASFASIVARSRTWEEAFTSFRCAFSLPLLPKATYATATDQ